MSNAGVARELLKRMVGARVNLPPIAFKICWKGICLQKAWVRASRLSSIELPGW